MIEIVMLPHKQKNWGCVKNILHHTCIYREKSSNTAHGNVYSIQHYVIRSKEVRLVTGTN